MKSLVTEKSRLLGFQFVTAHENTSVVSRLIKRTEINTVIIKLQILGTNASSTGATLLPFINLI